MNGKGSKQRPTNKKKFDENYEKIKWNIKKEKSCKKQSHPNYGESTKYENFYKLDGIF